MAIRLVVVDDHQVVRSGIASLLKETEIEVVAEAATPAEAVAKTREHRPDVVLLDIRLREGDGLSVLEEIHREMPDMRVVMLSTYDNPTYVARAHTLGASDYLLKGSSRDRIVGAIRAVAAGDAPSEFGEMRRVAGTMATRHVEPDGEVALTQRETQVLRHLALGLSNKEIGQSLSISVETVKEHVQHLLRKMHVADRTQAAVWAVKHGLA
ncbi:MAG TPA: response regulator transcription factor [Pirellulales bacterium]|jgi:DNA-binding NarL/FixJ family response regulator|nr:response regulator transcription factor [Pirellulales bacterium]